MVSGQVRMLLTHPAQMMSHRRRGGAFYEPAEVKPPLTENSPQWPRDGQRTLRLRSCPGSTPGGEPGQDRSRSAGPLSPGSFGSLLLGLKAISTAMRRAAGSDGVRRARGIATTFSPCPGHFDPGAPATAFVPRRLPAGRQGDPI